MILTQKLASVRYTHPGYTEIRNTEFFAGLWRQTTPSGAQKGC